MPLTYKQLAFTQEYLLDYNATKSAIRAGYSEKTARQIGAENLTKPVIQAYIQEQVRQRSERMQTSADKVLEELRKVALHEVKDIQASAKVRALELSGKHFNLWDNEKEKVPRVAIILEGRDLLL